MTQLGGLDDNDASSNEHQVRLAKCIHCLSNINENLSENTVLTLVFDYLYDTWSVVRLECFRILQRKRDYISKEIAITVIRNMLDHCKNCHCWQEIHGSLLGLSVVLPIVDSSQYQSAESVCLGLLCHLSTPVREASRNCLFTMQKCTSDKHNFVFKLVFLISSITKSVNATSEASTLTLDGVLGCLVDSFQEFPSLIVQFDVPFVLDDDSNSRKENKRINQPTIEFIDTLKNCMLHSASTVRQKAGQVFTIVLKSLLFPTNNQSSIGDDNSNVSAGGDFSSYLMEYIVEKVLIESLCETSVASWPIQEICLIISEEAMRGALSHYFRTTHQRQQWIDSSCGKSVLKLAEFLKNSLSVTLCHESFEVRRMSTQLLPLLARVAVTFHSTKLELISVTVPKQHVDEFVNQRSWFCSDSEHTANSKLKFIDCSTTVGMDFLQLVNVVWLGEVIKQNQHLMEALPPRQPFCNEQKCKYQSQYLKATNVPLDNWSLEVSGVLFEVENRLQFHQNIKTFATADKAVNPEFLSQVMLNCSAIVNFIEVCMQILTELYKRIGSHRLSLSRSDDDADESNHYSFKILISNDCAECLTLIMTFLVSFLSKFSDQHGRSGDIDLLIQSCEDNLNSCLDLCCQWTTHLHELHKRSECTNKMLFRSIGGLGGRYTPEATGWLSTPLDVGIDHKDSIVLIPALTDPATNPMMYSSQLTADRTHDSMNLHSDSKHRSSYHSPSQKTTSLFRNSSTKPAVQITEVNNIIISPHRTPRSTIDAVTTVVTYGGYQSMDRWSCEAISPLLCSITRCQLDKGNAVFLSLVVVNWIVSSLQNPLWLDCRPFSKRSLFEALFILLSFDKCDIAVENNSSESLQMSLKVWLGVAEAISLSIAANLEVKLVVCLIKSANHMYEHINLRYGLDNLSIESIQVLAESMVHYQSLYSTKIEQLSQQVVTLASSELAATAVSGADNVDDKDDQQQQSPSPAHEEEREVDEDEFSDWDEDSVQEGGDVDTMTSATIDCNTAGGAGHLHEGLCSRIALLESALTDIALLSVRCDNL